MKGGAAGGGYAQVVPMEDINLHFTGDFHAIGAAHNLLSALIDNHIYWGNALGIDGRRVAWRRAIDMNDRCLRQIVSSLGGVANGFPREDGFDITVASEVMAIFCLAKDLEDLKTRLGNIIVGLHARPQAGARQGPQGARRDGGAAEGRAGAQPGADARGHARLHPWRPVRQHRARLQLGAGHDDGAQARRLRGDRGGLRRRPGRREVHRHQVPQGRPQARRGRAGGDHPRAQDARRREEGRPQDREPEGARSRHGQPAAPRRERAASSAWCRWSRSTASAPTPRPRSRWSSGLRQAGRRGGDGRPLGRGRQGRGRRGARRGQGGRERQEQPEAALSRRHAAAATRSAPSPRRSTAPRTSPSPKPVRDQLDAFEAMGFGKVPVCIAKTQYSFSTNPDAKGAPDGHIVAGARGAAVGRRRVRRGGLRRHHDHARPAHACRPPTASTSTPTARSSGCSKARRLRRAIAPLYH